MIINKTSIILLLINNKHDEVESLRVPKQQFIEFEAPRVRYKSTSHSYSKDIHLDNKKIVNVKHFCIFLTGMTYYFTTYY